MSKEYSPLWFRLDGRDGFLLWYSSDQDGVYATKAGVVPTFGALNTLMTYAMSQGIPVDRGTSFVLHDLDAAIACRFSPGADSPDYPALLNFWNLCADIARTLGDKFEPECDECDSVYDKVFYANNLPSIKAEGEFYSPEWEPEEVALMEKILLAGEAMLRRRLKR